MCIVLSLLELVSIGIEVAENFVRRGLKSAVVELADQIHPPWDVEMVRPLEQHLREKGVELYLGESAEEFEESDSGKVGSKINVKLRSGDSLAADFTVISIGVRPESKLANDAGIECGPRGGIVTNTHMQTNDPDVYAVGDVVQVIDVISQEPTQIPLAGPANRAMLYYPMSNGRSVQEILRLVEAMQTSDDQNRCR